MTITLQKKISMKQFQRKYLIFNKIELKGNIRIDQEQFILENGEADFEMVKVCKLGKMGQCMMDNGYLDKHVVKEQ